MRLVFSRAHARPNCVLSYFFLKKLRRAHARLAIKQAETPPGPVRCSTTLPLPGSLLVKIKKTASGAALKPEPKPKKTRQGNGKRSKASHNRKLRCGQGR